MPLWPGEWVRRAGLSDVPCWPSACSVQGSVQQLQRGNVRLCRKRNLPGLPTWPGEWARGAGLPVVPCWPSACHNQGNVRQLQRGNVRPSRERKLPALPLWPGKWARRAGLPDLPFWPSACCVQVSVQQLQRGFLRPNRERELFALPPGGFQRCCGRCCVPRVPCWHLFLKPRCKHLHPVPCLHLWRPSWRSCLHAVPTAHDIAHWLQQRLCLRPLPSRLCLAECECELQPLPWGLYYYSRWQQLHAVPRKHLCATRQPRMRPLPQRLWQLQRRASVLRGWLLGSAWQQRVQPLPRGQSQRCRGQQPLRVPALPRSDLLPGRCCLPALRPGPQQRRRRGCVLPAWVSNGWGEERWVGLSQRVLLLPPPLLLPQCLCSSGLPAQHL